VALARTPEAPARTRRPPARPCRDPDRTVGGETRTRLEAEDGWTLGGETLRTAPRGWTVDHPRIELLRHKSLSLSRPVEDVVMCSPALVERVRDDWEELRELLEWLRPALVGTGEERRR
jgi:hypothetical protein